MAHPFLELKVMLFLWLFGRCLPLRDEPFAHENVCGHHSFPPRKAVPLPAPPQGGVLEIITGVGREPPLTSHHEIN